MDVVIKQTWLLFAFPFSLYVLVAGNIGSYKLKLAESLSAWISEWLLEIELAQKKLLHLRAMRGRNTQYEVTGIWYSTWFALTDPMPSSRRVWAQNTILVLNNCTPSPSHSILQFPLNNPSIGDYFHTHLDQYLLWIPGVCSICNLPPRRRWVSPLQDWGLH